MRVCKGASAYFLGWRHSIAAMLEGRDGDDGAGSSARNMLPQFSPKGQRQTYGLLKQLVSSTNADVIGLHGGLPPPESFPITALSATLADGTTLNIPAQLAQEQYNLPPTGLPSLQQWAERHIHKVHRPPSLVGVLINDGSSHGLEMATALFMQPGDILLVEEFTYSHFIQCVAVPRGYCVLPVTIDHRGIVPEQLEALLQRLAGDGRRPKMLYTVPTGHNPTGAVMPLERKRQVYKLCRRHGLMLLEDDPYAFLQFPHGVESVPGLTGLQLDSYLSLDTAGLVIRLDSFAKTLAPGLRLGWATAAPAVAERLAMSLQGSTLGGNMMSQALVSEMLAAWGEAGLHAHLQRLQRGYAARAAALHSAAQAELGGLAEWHRPVAGMFMWVKLLGVEDSLELLPELQAGGVVVVPGRVTSPLAQDPGFKCPWVRVSFANASEEQLVEGVRRLAAVLRKRAAAAAGVREHETGL